MLFRHTTQTDIYVIIKLYFKRLTENADSDVNNCEVMSFLTPSMSN